MILGDGVAMTRAFILLALLAGACASGAPAPISYGGGGGGQAEPAQSRPRAPIERREITRPQPQSERSPEQTQERPEPRVQQPQEQPNWADGEGRALSDFALRPEDVQPFDPANLPATHRVSGSETLYDIATTYQVPLRALIDQNNLEPPYALSEGRVLRLPPPRFHTVVRGESFGDVARQYNIDPRSLALLNRMQPPYQVRQGDRLVLPAMARAEPAPSPAPLPQPAPIEPIVRGSGQFAWPLDGDVIARFGAQPNGARVDGIEIAGLEGAPVVAAADGEVVYAGADLPEYGTLVLIRHADNYVTAYGHARRSLVREGQRVRAGERIAELGPNARGAPRLLFQVRQGSSAVDPVPLMGERGERRR
jgi:murein DD-endopeptidase MepM/ murein hydrolase activator NlpD